MATYYCDIEAGNDSWDGLSPVFTSGSNGPWRYPPGLMGATGTSNAKGAMGAGDTLYLIGKSTPWRICHSTTLATPFSTTYVNGVGGATAPLDQWKRWLAYPGTTPVVSNLTLIGADGTVDFGPLSKGSATYTTVAPQPGNPNGGLWSLYSSASPNFDVWLFDHSGSSFAGSTIITAIVNVYNNLGVVMTPGYQCVVTNSAAGLIQSHMYWNDKTGHKLYVSVPKSAGAPSLKVGAAIGGLSSSTLLFLRGVGECVIDGITFESGGYSLYFQGYDASNVIRDVIIRNNTLRIGLGATVSDGNNTVTQRFLYLINSAVDSFVRDILIERNTFIAPVDDMFTYPASVYAATPANEPYADSIAVIGASNVTIRKNWFFDAGHAFINLSSTATLPGGRVLVEENEFDGAKTNYGYPLGLSYSNTQTGPVAFRRNKMSNVPGSVQINCKADSLLAGAQYNALVEDNVWLNKLQTFNKPAYAWHGAMCLNLGAYVSSEQYNFGYVGIINNTVNGCDGPFVRWADDAVTPLKPGPVTILNNALKDMCRISMDPSDPLYGYTNMRGPVIAIDAKNTTASAFVLTTSNNFASPIGSTGTNGGYHLATGSATLTINGNAKAATGSSDAALTAGDCGVVSNADWSPAPDGRPLPGSIVYGAGLHTTIKRGIDGVQHRIPPSAGAYDRPTHRRRLDSDPAGW